MVKQGNNLSKEYMKINEIDDTKISLDKAYDILDRAYQTDNIKEAKKLASKAYQTDKRCLDAVIFLSDLEENICKKEKILNDGLKYEYERLKKEGVFKEENIGHFDKINETKQYMRGLYHKALIYTTIGKIKKAEELCLEMLKLNPQDNLNVRYLLMAIYAYLEDDKHLLKLIKKYPEENVSTLFPLCAIYYKQEKYDKAKEYITKLNKINPNMLKLFKGKIENDNDLSDNYYQVGTLKEVIVYFETYTFLLITLVGIKDFYLEVSKNTKNNFFKY